MVRFTPSLLLPFGFILLYGSGFVFTKYGLTSASPMAFLAIRFFIAFLILCLIAYFIKARWPSNYKEFMHISIAGMLTVGTFSIGVFLSLAFGISASLSALIIALQPILVSFLAIKFLGEEVNPKIWLGLLIGFFGVVFVVVMNIDMSSTKIFGVVFSIIALLGLSFGNLYQKKYCAHMNLFAGGAIQTLSSTLLVLPFLYFEEIRVVWDSKFIIALSYMSLGVSIGSLTLLYIMIKNGAVSKVSSIFYLVPVSAVIISYFLLDDALEWNVIIGITMVIFGIILVNKKEK